MVVVVFGVAVGRGEGRGAAAVTRLHEGGRGEEREECFLVACLTSQQHAWVSQGPVCSENFTCHHTVTEAADQNFPCQAVTAY